MIFRLSVRFAIWQNKAKKTEQCSVFRQVKNCISIFFIKNQAKDTPILYNSGRDSPPSSDGPPFCNVVLSGIYKSDFFDADAAFVYFLAG